MPPKILNKKFHLDYQERNRRYQLIQASIDSLVRDELFRQYLKDLLDYDTQQHRLYRNVIVEKYPFINGTQIDFHRYGLFYLMTCSDAEREEKLTRIIRNLLEDIVPRYQKYLRKTQES